MKVSEYIKQKTGFEFPNKLCFQNPIKMKKFLKKLKKIYKQVELPNIIKIRDYNDKKDRIDLRFYYSRPYIDIKLIMEEDVEIKSFVSTRFAFSSYYIIKDGKVIDYFKDLESLKNKNIKNRLVVFKDNNVWRQVTGIDFDKEHEKIYKIYYLIWGGNEYIIRTEEITFDDLIEKIKIIDSLENPENEKIEKYLFERIDSEIYL
jgi:hypothetical protein